MKWLIQNNIDITTMKNIKHCLETLEEEIILIDYPYIKEDNFETKKEEFENKIKNISEPVIGFGSVNFSDSIRRLNLYPGVMNKKVFCFKEIHKQLKNKNILLNEDAIFINPTTFNKHNLKNKVYFIRPSKDNKAFTGRITTTTQINNLLREALKKDSGKISKNTEFFISKLKDVKNEVRCFVINGKLSTASYYRIDYVPLSEEITYNDNIFYFLQNKITEIEKYYKPSDCYVIDFNIDDNKNLKVIEYNSLNSSGLYHCSADNIIKDLIKFYK